MQSKGYRPDRVNNVRAKNKHNIRDEGEEILKDFVWANRDLVDKDLGDKFFRGEASVINKVLEQIHWRSLEARSGGKWATMRI